MTDSDTGKPEPEHGAMPPALRVTVYAVVLAAVLLAAIRWLNHNSVFPPVAMDHSVGPRLAAERNDVREISIPTSDELELYGWVQGPDSARHKVILFGGNAEYTGPGADLTATNAGALDAQFLRFDYRGYANSPGRPSEIGLYRDARAAYRYAVDELGWDPGGVVLWGRSLGCAPAVKLAHELSADELHGELHPGAPPLALILESPFLSIQKMAAETMGFLGKPEWLVYSLFDNASRAPGVECPVFVMHGTRDSIIPFRQSEELYKKFDAPSEFMKLNGADHNDTWHDIERATQIRLRIAKFIEAYS